jgi:hypothetical protein
VQVRTCRCACHSERVYDNPYDIPGWRRRAPVSGSPLPCWGHRRPLTGADDRACAPEQEVARSSRAGPTPVPRWHFGVSGGLVLTGSTPLYDTSPRPDSLIRRPFEVLPPLDTPPPLAAASRLRRSPDEPASGTNSPGPILLTLQRDPFIGLGCSSPSTTANCVSDGLA